MASISVYGMMSYIPTEEYIKLLIKDIGTLITWDYNSVGAEEPIDIFITISTDKSTDEVLNTLYGFKLDKAGVV